MYQTRNALVKEKVSKNTGRGKGLEVYKIGKQGAGLGEVNSPLHLLQAFGAVAADFRAGNGYFHMEVARNLVF